MDVKTLAQMVFAHLVLDQVGYYNIVLLVALDAKYILIIEIITLMRVIENSCVILLVQELALAH